MKSSAAEATQAIAIARGEEPERVPPLEELPVR
jgi:hypothetical protein